MLNHKDILPALLSKVGCVMILPGVKKFGSESQMSFYLKLVMLSDPRYLSVIRAAVGEIGLVCGLPEESCRELILALDEAVANVIRHAYKNRYDQEIELTCRVATDQMEFTLLDQGEPPDPARICGQLLNDVSLSGRGTHMIKAIMDEMCYRRVPEGNQLKLVKHLPTTKVGVDGH